MNKKLLAVAIAGVLAAPLAQAQTANVTLYGRLNMSTNVILNAKQDASCSGCVGLKQNIYQVGSNSSRLGVRGTESLGGGLNAIFQLEERFDASNGSLVTTTGDTYAGLQGGWGTMKIGYFLTPYDDVAPVFGSVPTLITSPLSTSALWSNSGSAGLTAGGFDNRAGNSLRYDSPVMSGFTFSAQVSGRDTGSTVSSDGGDINEQRRHAYIMGFGSTYNNGPFSAAIAYQVQNNLRGGTNATYMQLSNPSAKLQDQGLTLAASYTFGGWKFAGVGEWVKYDVPATGAFVAGQSATSTGTGDLKRNLWGISTTGNLGPGQLYAAYFKSNNVRGSGGANCFIAQTGQAAAGNLVCPRVGAVTLGGNASGITSDSSAQMWTVSYTYPLSKRTLLYAGYVMIDNKNNAGYNFNVGAVSGLCNVNNAQQGVVGPQTASFCGDAARPQSVLAGMVHFW
jgi:predicted porin